jgi:hypothetical protein
MAGDEYVHVRFTDGHREGWRVPDGQTPDDVLGELQQVIASGQWFRVPDGARVYSPYAIVSVEISERDPDEDPSVARKLGEAVADALDPDR